MKRYLIMMAAIVLLQLRVQAQDAKMDSFITNLMSKMTLYEKLGQLNLSSGVGNVPVIATGDGMAEYIRKGLIGGS